MTDTVSLTKPLTAQELAIQQQSIERQRKIADLLQQQSMKPDEGQMVSGIYVPPSGLSQVAKLAQALSGAYQQRNLDEKAAGIVQKQGDMQRAAFGLSPASPAASATAPADQPASAALSQGAAVGSLGPTNENAGRLAQALQSQAPPASPQPEVRGTRTLPGMTNLQAFYESQNNPTGYSNAYLKQFEPTEATRLAMAAGLDPKQANADTLNKNTYIAPINAREGSTIIDPKTMRPVFNAPNKEGIQYQFDQNGNSRATQVPGFESAVSNYEAAKVKGKNTQTLASPDFSPVAPDGRIAPTTVDSLVNPQQRSGLDLSKLDPATAAYLQKKDPEAFARGVQSFQNSAPNGPPLVGAPFGQKEGAVDAQKELSKKFSALTEQNQQAQTTNSYLDSIAALAKKAQSGPFSDRQAFINALLNQAGISEKATDELSAKQLLDKYNNQITSRLGVGGNGTDAARAIIQAAYPNSKMTPQAIEEAVANIKGGNVLTNAKLALLLPHANERNPKAYNEKEAAFDQLATPHVFQYANANPQQRAAMKQKMMQNGTAQDFARRLRGLEQLGVKFQ